ncbi:sialate O-acetylesterase [Akkermansiaceae bacterium]|nr:sialate O-acetylesterase [Akkermansiaceae bacterium]
MNSPSALALSLLLASQSTSLAEVRVGSLFQNGMVLQREMAVPVWGLADAGEEVTVTFADQKKSTKADQNGKWLVRLDALEGSKEGRELKVSGENEMVLKDVVVGEVWICSGQSNMQMGPDGIPEIKALIPKAKQLSTFEVPRTAAFTEQDYSGGQWKTAHPNSAVAFSFAYFLQEAADLPVGIILACWGSSSLEAWMPRDMTGTVPHFATIMKEFDADQKTRATLQAIFDGPKPWSRNEDIFIRRQPNILYNAMMKPLAPFACRGLVWYQGERNAQSMAGMATNPWFGRHSGVLRYGDTLQKWIERYRQEWNREEMELMIVMLPGYGKSLNSGPKTGPQSPIAHSWAWMRESQLQALDLPHTSVINTIDLGDIKNVHPKDKLPIGKRLALTAAKNTLGKDLISDGPTFKNVTISGKKITAHFDHAEGLTTTDKKAPNAFWIANDSKNWTRADAKISGNTVVLTSKKVPAPKYIRYAFAGLPKVNLINASGLPALPFRTDSFRP